MKVYLDTTIIILLLFSQKSNPDRYQEVKRLFDAIDASQIQAVISIYALQELCSVCYANFPADDAPTVTRLAFHELLAHELLLTPLLNRTIVLFLVVVFRFVTLLIKLMLVLLIAKGATISSRMTVIFKILPSCCQA